MTFLLHFGQEVDILSHMELSRGYLHVLSCLSPIRNRYLEDLKQLRAVLSDPVGSVNCPLWVYNGLMYNAMITWRFLILNSKSRKFCHVLYFDVYLYSEELTLSLSYKNLNLGDMINKKRIWMRIWISKNEDLKIQMLDMYRRGL